MKNQLSNIANGLKIFKSILDVKMGKRIPIYCEWEVTSHCNMKCDFCSTRINDRNTLKDASTQEALIIIEQLSEMGTKIIHFSGGEPTLRKDLPELITKAKESNMVVSFTTNGSLSLEKMKKLLHADLIRVSIDGTEKFHDSVRKTLGAFNKAIKMLEYLMFNGIKPQITTVYTPETSYKMLKELTEIAKGLKVQMAINVLGKNVNADFSNNNGGDLKDLRSNLFTEYVKIVHRLRNCYGNVISNPEPLHSVIQSGGLDVFGCRAMDISISIKHDGSISMPCNGLALRLDKGNIKEIFYSREALELRPLQGRHPACKGCYIKCMSSASAFLKMRGLTTIIDSYIRSLF